MGTTGERDRTRRLRAAAWAARVKAVTDLPVLIGFGDRRARPRRPQAARGADGVVVGAALMRRVLDGATPAELGDLADRCVPALDQ